MVKCAVRSCKNDTRIQTKLKSSITFHSFPKDRNLMNKWIIALNDTNFDPNKWNRVCSEHFLESNFYETKKGLRKLISTAVPSLFLSPSTPGLNWTAAVSCYSGKVTVPFAQHERSTSNNLHIDSEVPPDVFSLLTNVDDTPTTRKLKKEVIRWKEIAKRRRLRCNALYATQRRLKKKVERLLQEINELKGNAPSASKDMHFVAEVRPLISNVDDTPRKRKLEKEILRLKDVAKRRQLRFNALYATRRRFKKKLQDLSEVLYELKEKRFITQEQVDSLELCGVSAAALIRRIINKDKEYSPEIRTFALTLHFYSAKAYSYIRSTFNTCLPHPDTIRKWYQCLDANPGFTAEAFNALREKVKATEDKILCNLVTDEMSISKLKEFDGNKVQGFVDFGAGIYVPGDTTVLCTQALVFLLVAVNGRWKMPVGYFLVDSVTGEQRANLVRMCLSNCHEVGIEVVSMTFDGCPANMAMARELGCSFDVGQLKTYFPHPETEQPIYVFLDPCHMVKLVRNTLESKKIFQDNNGGLIKWQYFVQLNTVLQVNDKLQLSNKLTTSHIDFKNQVTKVKLAVQLLSTNVAKTIEFCDQKLHLVNFANSAATVNFIHVINNIFDILTSRKFLRTDLKAPINEKNESKYITFLENAKTYLQTLMLPNDNQNIVHSRNQIGFLGLCVCIDSMKELYNKLVKQEQKMNFLAMYKMSQDHMEILFSVIRSHGGFNNKPSASQFRAIYKKLLVHKELNENFRGNCASLEQITLLNCSSSADHINLTTKGHRSASEEDDAMVGEQFMSNFEDDLNLPTGLDHAFFSQHVISYIAGYVTRYLLSKIECTDCLSALVAISPCHYNSFILFKDRGLMYPSEDVIHICKAAEKIVKSNIESKNRADCDPRGMVTKTLKLFIGKDIFNVLHTHLFEQEPCSNHLLHLLRAVIQKYIDIRVKNLVRKPNVKKTKTALLIT